MFTGAMSREIRGFFLCIYVCAGAYIDKCVVKDKILMRREIRIFAAQKYL